jgi:hypothetical protein
MVPCLNCKNRYLGCHDSCNYYKEFKDEKEIINNNYRHYMESYSAGIRNRKFEMKRG